MCSQNFEWSIQRVHYKGLEENLLKAFSITDIGKRREINEDYIYASERPVGELPNLFIVADGMGGHNAGDYASQHAVEKVVEVIQGIESEWTDKKIDVDRVKSDIQRAINEANAYIYKRSVEETTLRGMGTTLVVACYINKQAVVANVGDSRLYLVNEEIKQITQDHSLVEEMVNLGGIDRESARNHPDKNIITRAVGVKESVIADFFDVPIKSGDRVLLCSDGLTNMLEDKEIHRIIRGYTDIEQAAKELIQAANENGGRDNIAVVLVEPFGGHE